MEDGLGFMYDLLMYDLVLPGSFTESGIIICERTASKEDCSSRAHSYKVSNIYSVIIVAYPKCFLGQYDL
jgi:hypothetical protein